MVRLATTTIDTSSETRKVATAVRLSTWYGRGIRDPNEVVIHAPLTVLVRPGNDCSDCTLVAYQRRNVCCSTDLLGEADDAFLQRKRKVGHLPSCQLGQSHQVVTHTVTTRKEKLIRKS